MSIRVMTKVWELDLPAKEKLVLLALADCANDEGLAWPSIATIARKCGCDPRTVQRNLRDLETAGLIRREEVNGKGCKYYFNPRQFVTPDNTSPVTNRPKTPDKSPPKPSRTINNRKKPAHPLPNAWEPLPFTTGTQSRKIVDGWPPGALAERLEAFAAHHRARENKFSDWQAAWSTWVLNSRKFNNDNAIRTTGSTGSDRRSSLAKAIDEGLDWLG